MRFIKVPVELVRTDDDSEMYESLGIETDASYCGPAYISIDKIMIYFGVEDQTVVDCGDDDVYTVNLKVDEFTKLLNGCVDD